MDQILANPTLLIVAVACIVFAVVIALSVRSTPYEPAKALMTDAELNFYRQLMRIVPPGMLVFSKVRIADIIVVKDSIKGKGRAKHFNPIAAKHFDFVLVDDKKMHILGAIELNDSSHNRKDRQERDAFVRKVMTAAGLPLFEVKASRKYKLDALRRDLQALSPAFTPDALISVQSDGLNSTAPANTDSQPEVNTTSVMLQSDLPAINYASVDSEPIQPHVQQDEYKPKPLSSFMEVADNQTDSKLN